MYNKEQAAALAVILDAAVAWRDELEGDIMMYADNEDLDHYQQQADDIAAAVKVMNTVWIGWREALKD